MNRLIISILLCLLISACTKDKLVWEEVFFEFEMPFSISPGKDTVKVGDTLKIQCSLSDSLFDYRTQKRYYLPDFYFDNSIALYQIGDSSKYLGQQPIADKKFKFFSMDGQYFGGDGQFVTLLLLMLIIGTHINPILFRYQQVYILFLFIYTTMATMAI